MSTLRRPVVVAATNTGLFFLYIYIYTVSAKSLEMQCWDGDYESQHLAIVV